MVSMPLQLHTSLGGPPHVTDPKTCVYLSPTSVVSTPRHHRGHDIANEAHHRLLHDVPKLDDVTVHVSPSNDDGQDHHLLTAHHRQAAAAEPTRR